MTRGISIWPAPGSVVGNGEIPFSFITGARKEDWDHDRGHRFPLSPKLSLDDTVKVIQEAATPAKPGAVDPAQVTASNETPAL